ncbi:unnamed protein product [Arctogadus glacialis]
MMVEGVKRESAHMLPMIFDPRVPESLFGWAPCQGCVGGDYTGKNSGAQRDAEEVGEVVGKKPLYKISIIHKLAYFRITKTD